jgi:hypothetical protein
VRAGRTDAERAGADRRAAGRTGEEIAAEVDGEADALRRTFNRAVRRPAPCLGLAEGGEDDDE